MKTYIMSVYGYDNMRVPISANNEKEAYEKFMLLVEVLEVEK